MAGVEYIYVSAPEGGNKADGHFGAGVSDDLLKKTQAEANELYEIFVNCVARNRPMTPEQIRDTKADSYRKEASLAMGLIDMVASSVDISSVAADVFAGIGSDEPETQPGDEAAQTNPEKEMEMTEEEKAALAAKSKSEGVAEGATAAKERISKILGSEDAKGREALAQHFAFNTDLDADSAIAAMKVSPVAAAPATPEPKSEKKNDDQMQKSFDDQMNKHAPNLSPDKKADEEKDAATKSLEASMALAKSAGIGGYNFANS